MNRILKVLCAGPDQRKLADKYSPIERYPGFILLEVPARAVKRLARAYPLEDITDLYAIPVADRVVDTRHPRIDKRGRVHPHAAYAATKRLAAGRHHYLVQFVGPIKSAWLKAVRAAGGELREPYRDFTYIVRADAAALKRIAALRSVRWLGHLPHRARIATSVRNPKRAGAGTLPRSRIRAGLFTVQFFGAAELKRALAPIKKLGFKIVAKDPKAKLVVVATDALPDKEWAQIEKLSAIHGVRTIRERTLKRASNDVAATIMGSARVWAARDFNLSGVGETIAVCDTGLDSGNADDIHPDFAGRIAWIKSYPIADEFSSEILNPRGDDGAADLDSGHGTHVAGSVLGNGTGTKTVSGAPLVRGAAYKAKLVFQAVEQAIEWKDPANYRRYGRYLLAGIPLDLATLFGDAYRKGARIHSNSWGGGAPGAYDAQCEQLDRFVWGRKDFCVLFAAGNDGSDHDGDGRINLMSVTSPGTAKNCITVGASENVRPQFASETYGKWWPQDYPALPFRTDPMANKADDIVAFSSRGPTRDGRVKPDVVAPGTFILSTRSTRIAANNKGWAAYPPSKLYFHMGGTSMATPLAAGAIGLIREYLRTQKRVRAPSAALLKATLIAGAVRIGKHAKVGVADNHQGFGRVDLAAVLTPAKPLVSEFHDVRAGLRTGEIKRFTVKLKSAGALRVVLAYSDYPGPALVNNLNLVAISPRGQRYVGNQSEAGTLLLDTRNNVEVVHIARAAAGEWTLEVVASNIARGPQDFALVCIAPL